MGMTNTKDLIAYLSNLYAVETDIYEQERLLLDLTETMDVIDGKKTAHHRMKQEQIEEAIQTEELDNAWKKYEVNKAFLSVPKRTKPTEPAKPTCVPSGWGCNTIFCIIIAVFIPVCSLIMGGTEIFSYSPFLCIYLPIILLVIAGITYIYNMLTSKDRSEKLGMEYAAYMRKYEAEMKTYREYEEEQKQLKQTVEDAERAYNRTKVILLQSLKLTAAVNANEVFSSLEPLLKVRKKLYDRDIIFPKYRTLPCVATMLEYLQSGRCSELEGPDGAYNLYESELRADLIISRLDDIASVLGKIRDAQYNLYQSVLRSEKALKTTNAQLQTILNVQKNIAEIEQKQLVLESVTASCALAMESHTKAIKYLELID